MILFHPMMGQPLQSQLEAQGKRNPFWIAGPCVLEDSKTNDLIAGSLAEISGRLNIPVVFKASFDKANRTSGESPRGPGIEEGLRELARIKTTFGLSLLTDIHEAAHAKMAAEVVDILQIPAFLCRQTDLLIAAAKTGRCINVKKGQFLGPHQVAPLLKKLARGGAVGSWITERGTTFGYERLVVDFAAFEEMECAGAHLIMDITHAVQLPGKKSGVSGGIREAIPYLARAAAGAGVYGFFCETHPEPERALSDGANAWRLQDLESLMKRTQSIALAAHG